MDRHQEQPDRADGVESRPALPHGVRAGLERAGSGLTALARHWGPLAATGVQRAAARARESRLAGRTAQAAGRAGRAIQYRSRAVKEQVSGWTWPRRVLADVARRYPGLDRAWKQFLHSFSLSDRPAQAPQPPLRMTRRPQAKAPGRPASARPARTRSNLRKAA